MRVGFVRAGEIAAAGTVFVWLMAVASFEGGGGLETRLRV
ncbi:hypothetical protein Z948_2781 [Sulfitobacter donghicola DSW-25 = KCTC 12864 = JCM 14565]|uniref:Uncharacterized protein n=1 Tax=Sulfitobacter donghicola DSW-25 = KCTC 12864 = JCM 14565 TaxID=1300350 RepID=A0A073IH31_9RHOB|nr:hypothetical protein DSW25_09485 [Sulfitobacter donghicola DSW-25 = KCTC 12864 = JCM 14565]KIN69047.1 hypothetical protein Z948_2781 [Sulfitobacter donghicola DSW-25 = KCTC 12864 = JCM 14565]